MIDPTTLDDHAFAAWLAERGRRRGCSRSARQGPRGPRAQGRRRPRRPRALTRLLPSTVPTTRCCPRRRADDKVAADRPTGSGSSTRSTAPGSSPSRRATTGPSTSPCGRTASWPPAPSPSPRSARRSTPAARPSYLRAPSDRPRIAVSRTRPPAFVEALADEIDAELVPMGSAGVKVISVVRDVTDAYVHAGGQYEWDNAAPVAVARAAGLFCSRVDGSQLRYNQDDVLAAGPDRVPPRARRADPRLRPPPRHRLSPSAPPGPSAPLSGRA